MKFKQKIVFGLSALALFISGLSAIIHPSPVHAAESLETKLSGCAEEIAAELAGSHLDSNSVCKFFNNSNPPGQCGPQQQYGYPAGLEIQYASQIWYQLPYRAGGYNDPNNPPKNIALIDPTTKKLVTPPPSVSQGAYSNFVYTGRSYETPGYKLDYWEYQSSYNTNFKLLLAMRPSGSAPVILTMVNSGKNVNGDELPVCAYHLNLPAALSNPDGSIIPPDYTGGTTTPPDACYASGWALGWLFCPLIEAAQKSANIMYGFVEDQLHFTVSQDNKTQDSLGSPETRKGVHDAWSNFRILVSGLVVILLLIMVISQAIGSGPFDAYTVKKMLPRLVIGVILIQISWPLFSWVINTVDDLGRGLADLMYAPFGGAGKMNLLALLGPFGTEAIAFNWVGIGALVVFGVVAPFVILGLLLAVLAAIFAGFLTLLFRKILIILALILVPVALISWMMPGDGLRIYWKKWWENFSKALMMFPLIIAIIAAGRIFAKIGSSQGGDFVGFFIVLIGFFGPLFILPKTFKWGGTAMTAIGNGVSKAQERGLKRPKEFLGERQKDWGALRQQRSQLRMEESGDSLRKGWGRNPAMWWRRPLDLVKAGKLDPTRGLPSMRIRGRGYQGSEMRRDAVAGYIEAGGKRYDERRAADARKWQRTVEEQIAEDYTDAQGNRLGVTKDKVFQDIADGIDTHFYDYQGRRIEIKAEDIKPMDQRVALDRLAQLGGAQNFRHIEKAFETAMRSGDQRTASSMRKFLNDNVETLLPKMTHLYKGIASTSDAHPEAIAQMHGVEIEAMIAELSHRINTGTDTRGRPTDVGAAQRQLSNFLTSYAAAAADPQLGGRLEAGGLRAVAAFMSGNPNHQFLTDPVTGIQSDPQQGRGSQGKRYYDAEAGISRQINPVDPTAVFQIQGQLSQQALANLAQVHARAQ